MPKTKTKYNIQMAGEFLTAGELFRKGFFASVSFGNAKSFDIVARSPIKTDKFAYIEVKSSDNGYFTRRSTPIYIDDHKFLINIITTKKEIDEAKPNFSKFYVFVALNGKQDKADFYLFSADRIFQVVKKKMGAIPPEKKISGPWNINLSDIFETKEHEISYCKENDYGWIELRDYLR